MRRNVTAIYRSHDVAALVRDELERLGLTRRHIAVLPDNSVLSNTVLAPDALDGDKLRPSVVPAATTTEEDVHRDNLNYAFDRLHDLHLPEADARVYQQAIRNGDVVVSVDVDDDADLARIQEVMRRPEDAYDLDDLDTRYADADYAPRRRPLSEDYNDGMLGRRDDTRSDPYSRYYSREMPLWPRGGV